MFILIPVILILASFAGILVIVFRKMPYLSKLTPETHLSDLSARAGFFGVVSGILTDLFPELPEGFRNPKLKEYGNLWLVELEKLLRRLRVVSLKMDRISDTWIKKIRSGSAFKSVVPVLDKEVTEKTLTDNVQTVQEMTMDEAKKEEQRLIIEIAKNPKDSSLYEVLGDLYVKMKNFYDAKESFEAAIELSPQNEKLKKKHSQVLEKMLIS